MSQTRRRPSTLPTAPWRALSAALAALVFGLALAGASPDLHAWLHAETVTNGHDTCSQTDHAPAGDKAHEHRCAVVLFANGADLPFTAVVVLLPDAASSAVDPIPDALYLARPRYLRHPERGPPLA